MEDYMKNNENTKNSRFIGPKVRERVKMAMTSYKPEKTIHLNI
jgi:hypothetical protein